MTPWGTQVEEQWPQLIGSVGSLRLPSTPKAIARFFRAFPRCYATRRGFHAVRRATGARRLFLVVSVFTAQATPGQAPIDVIVPAARRLPLSRLINAPFQALQERTDVKPEATMAD